MNQQIKDIKNYNQFFNYIGSDFGKNMTDLDILIHCYKKAREKKYIKNYRNNNNANSQSHINIGLEEEENYLGEEGILEEEVVEESPKIKK